MIIQKEEAKKIANNWGWKRLPSKGRQYLHVGKDVEVLENNNGVFHYGWQNETPSYYQSGLAV